MKDGFGHQIYSLRYFSQVDGKTKCITTNIRYCPECDKVFRAILEEL
jgi:hypothetical protein